MFERPKLLILSHKLIFHSQNSENIQNKLIELINKGYDKPRFKYNVIKTARIKFSLGLDLEIQDKEDTVIGICVHHDLRWTKDHEVIFAEKDIDVEYIDDDEFDITESLFKQIIGSVGLKPVKSDAMEVTALTSFYPKLGATLVKVIENYMVTQSELKVYNKLYAHVIVEHELVPFYSKLGFQTIEETLVEIDPHTGKVVGGDLEDGIELTKSFNLALMDKKVYR